MPSRSINGMIKNNSNIQRNLGIEILRAYLCFRIVILHYYSSKKKIILKLRRNRFQVPCFFFISFFFLYPIISKRNNNKLRLRLERLCIPYIIHPIVNFGINNIMFIVIKFNRYNRLLTFNDLKTQIVIGRGIYGIAVLWFHFNLIIFTLFYFIFSHLLKNNFLVCFQIIAIFSYKYQYSGINYIFFKKYTENIWMSIGNLLETFPITIAAFSFSSSNVHQILSKNRLKYLLFSILFLYLIFYYNLFSYIHGFSSTGIKQVFISIFLFILFYLIPLEMLNSKLLFLIKQITKYTQGIYCIHFLIQYYMRLIFEKKGSFIGCIWLYVISYFISFIGYKIFEKGKLKFLFN